MIDNQNNDNNSKLSEEELNYLYSLYKSSQSGSSTRLSKDQIRKIIENDIYKGIKFNNKNKSTSSFLAGMLWKQAELEIRKNIPEEEWQKLGKMTQQQLILLYFICEYGMDPFRVNKIFKNRLDKQS